MHPTSHQQHALQQHYLDKHCADLAGQRSMEALLNCYCRDIAAPAGELALARRSGQCGWPHALRMQLSLGSGRALHIRLPELNAEMLLAEAGDSLAGHYRFLSAPFYKIRHRGWQRLDLTRLARILLQSLALRFQAPFNSELYRQILGSRAVMHRILGYSRVPAQWGRGLAAYRWSEQALSFGHRYHPAPKAREGFDEADILQYSPEMGSSFALYYFAVRPEDLRGRGLDARAAQALAAPPDLAVPGGYRSLPVHPWQARYLLRQPCIQAAIRSGRLRPLGQAGAAFCPTASVRTLYQPGNPFFFKCSTHVRLTNCVRKNAHYELESAVALSRLLRTQLAPHLADYPGFTLLYEPAYATVDFAEAKSGERQALMEGFGLILRESLDAHLQSGVTPLLAASLFTPDRFGRCPATEVVNAWSRRIGLGRGQATQAWFHRYLELLMSPVLDALFRHGVVFEPHLQNVVVGLDSDYPAQVFVRDLEGTKLVPGRWTGRLPEELGEPVLKSILYSAKRGWQRIAYCLLINNLFQVVAGLAGDDSVLERQLWQVWRAQLCRLRDRLDDPWARDTLDGLLRGEDLPNKSNLLTRLFQCPDRESGYVPVANPLARLNRDQSASASTITGMEI